MTSNITTYGAIEHSPRVRRMRRFALAHDVAAAYAVDYDTLAVISHGTVRQGQHIVPTQITEHVTTFSELKRVLGY